MYAIVQWMVLDFLDDWSPMLMSRLLVSVSALLGVWLRARRAFVSSVALQAVQDKVMASIQ